jgi:Ca2+-binding RTX toxin-like protein
VGADLTLVGTGYGGKLTVTGGNGNDTITGGNGADLISTGSGNDTINVGCGADTVSAGAGGDTIVVGGTGNMTIYGEAGNDTINMASYLSSGDVISGGDNVDTLITTGNTAAGSFAGVSGIETVKMYGVGMSLSLNSSDVTAFASGVTVDLTATGNQTLNLVAGTAGFTGAVTVKMTAGATGLDTVNAAGSLGTITVFGNMADNA